MAEYSANAVQTVAPGEAIVFTTTVVPCNRGFIRHREGSGNFLLSGWLPNQNRRRCCCNRGNRQAQYLVDFGANISIPTDGTVGEISVAFSLDGSTLPDTTMTVTPAAVEEAFNVSRATNVGIWNGCCETVTVRNISDQPILVENANIVLTRPDLALSY